MRQDLDKLLASQIMFRIKNLDKCIKKPTFCGKASWIPDLFTYSAYLDNFIECLKTAMENLLQCSQYLISVTNPPV